MKVRMRRLGLGLAVIASVALLPSCTPLTEVLGISADSNSTCAVRTDGTIACWGYPIGDGSGVDGTRAVPVWGISDAVGVVVGGGHACALLGGGTVKCWGSGGSGQLGDGTIGDSDIPRKVLGLTGVTGLVAGWDFTCALVSSGVKCWGGNNFGQLGNGTTTEQSAPVSVIGVTGGYNLLAAGDSHVCAASNSAGTLVKCWGYNDYGQLGDGTTITRLVPVQVQYPQGLGDSMVSLAADGRHTCSVRKVSPPTSTAQCWGANSHGQLGDGTDVDRLTPTTVSGLTNTEAIAAGGYHTCARMEGGSVKCWGSNYNGELGTGTAGGVSLTPVAVPDLAASRLSAGDGHTCAVLSDNQVKCWGYNGSGQLGNGNTTDAAVPGKVLAEPAPTLVSSVVEMSQGCARLSNGNVTCWGSSSAGVAPGDIPNVTATAVPGVTGATALGGSEVSPCVLLAGGAAKCWGANDAGQLGDGTTNPRSTPVSVSGLTGATKLVQGSSHSCALLSSGTVKCWGSNVMGQLGDDTGVDRLTPTVVPGLSGVQDVVAERDQTCVVLSTGTAKCWGSGPLGNGDENGSYSPVPVTGITGVTKVFPAVKGDIYTIGPTWCASASGGAMWCWGSNASGQLGDGTTTDRLAPVRVPQLDGASSIVGGEDYACAARNGLAYCWGKNDVGQLGDGTTIDRHTPVWARTDLGVWAFGDVVSVAVTEPGGTCASTSNGLVACWGDNRFGELGDDSFVDRHYAATVIGLANATTLTSTNFGSFCARREDATIACWGLNQGWDGTRGNYRPLPTPLEVK